MTRRKAINSIKIFVNKHWLAILISLAVVALLVNILMFFPGYMSNDSILMYYVARGDVPSDLAPVMLGLVWRFLYIITGQTSSILILQLLMLWSSLVLLAIYVFKKTKSKIFSASCLAIGWLPFVFNISGVIWRDNHMTFALMLAVVLLLFTSIVTNKKLRVGLFIAIVGLIFYAAISRYNAIIAVVPMVFLVARASQYGIFKKLHWQIIAAVLSIPLTFFVLFPLANHVIGATSSNNQPGILLDDIVGVSNSDMLKKIAMPDELRSSLLAIQKCSVEKSILVDNMGFCADNNTRSVLYEYYKEFQRIWLEVLADNPLGYIYHKASAFFNILVPIRSYIYVWQDGIVPNKYNEMVKFESLGIIGSKYVQLSSRYLRATFEPWFWMLAGLTILGLSIKKRSKHKLIINTLCISGILYILGYIPTGVAPDYRYIYWPVLAIIFAFVLYGIDKYNGAHDNSTC